MTVQDLDRTAFEQDWADWHRQHQAALADEHGFLAITSLQLADRQSRSGSPTRRGPGGRRPGVVGRPRDGEELPSAARG